MKNIQVIDGGINCVYDIFQATDEEFATIFQDGEDIAFIDEVIARSDETKLDQVFTALWKRRIKKIHAHGIHGILFYELNVKKDYYPTRRDEEACNPGGYNLRSPLGSAYRQQDERD
jgi:hypothetical protein